MYRNIRTKVNISLKLLAQLLNYVHSKNEIIAKLRLNACYSQNLLNILIKIFFLNIQSNEWRIFLEKIF